MYKWLVIMVIVLGASSCSDNEELTTENSSTEDTVMDSADDQQQDSKYQFAIENSCGFDRSMINETVYSFDSDNEAEDALKRIMRLTGLPANFEIRAASIPNACAVIKCDDNGDCDRYILYNQEFMERVKDETNTSFAELSVLAHEIAHHLSGHTLANTGSSYDMELEADKFAGFMLYKMGATIEETKKAFSNLSKNGTATHPPKSARVAAVTNGWYDAKRNGEVVVDMKKSTGGQQNDGVNSSSTSSRSSDDLYSTHNSNKGYWMDDAINETNRVYGGKPPYGEVNMMGTFLHDVTWSQQVGTDGRGTPANSVKVMHTTEREYIRIIYTSGNSVKCVNCKSEYDRALLRNAQYYYRNR